MTDRVLLVFPPLWVRPLHPYCSLPYLSGYLKSRGIGVDQCDLNLRYHRHYLRPAPLARIYGHLKDLERKLSGVFPWTGGALLRVTRHGQIDEAVAVLTGERDGFFDLPTYRWAWEVVDGAVAQVNAYHQVGFAWPEGDFDLPEAEQAREELLTFLRQALGGRKPTPTTVGVSLVASTQVEYGMEVARIARELYPGARIVLGGAQVTCAVPYLDEHLQRFTGADWLVAYDGEEALEAICREEDPGRVPNAFLLEGRKVWKPSELKPVDIASTPPPSYEELPLCDYLSPQRVLYLQSSRGCYWAKCTFCPIHRLSLRYQARPGNLVAEDMAHLARLHDVGRFYFVDEVLSPGSLRELATAVRQRGLEVTWEGEARLERKLDRDLIREIREAGCRKLFFGLESASPAVLDRMQKGIDLAVASHVLESCFLENVAVGLFCIIAFPGERRDDLVGTVRFVLQRRKLLDRPGVSIDFTPFRLFRPARVAEQPERFGIRILWAEQTGQHGLLLPFVEEGGPSEHEKAQMKAAVDRTMLDNFRYLLALHEPDDLVYLGVLASNRYPKLVTRNDLSGGRPVRVRATYPHPRPSFHWEEAVADGEGGFRVPDSYTGRLEPALEEEIGLLGHCTGEASVEALAATMASQWEVPEEDARGRCLKILRRSMAYGRVYLLEKQTTGGQTSGEAVDSTHRDHEGPDPEIRNSKKTIAN